MFVAFRRVAPRFRLAHHLWVQLLLALFLLAAGFLSPGFAPGAERPNIIVILCDDLGYGDLACYGHPAIKTPHLDKLAADGIRFTQCYSSAPVCSSSRAGLMTGKTPSRIGVYDWIPANHPMHLKQEEQTIATILKKAGYATCHVGKWHLNGRFNSPDQPQPGDHGFEHWMSTQNNAAPSHENPNNFVRNGTPIGPQEGYSCQVVANESIRWMKELRDKSKPFFQFVCFHEPHEPVASPADLVAEYAAASGDKVTADENKAGGDTAPEDKAQYFANVANVDRGVGRILDALDELKLTDRTLVFFTSDNGPETLLRYPRAKRSHGSAGPLRGMKLHLYEGGIRVPGILRYPALVKPGQTVSEPVCALDLLPTFCEMAGAALPAEHVQDGTSILPLLGGQEFVRTKPLYWHYFRSIGAPKAALRVGDYMILGHWDGPELGPGGSVHHGDCEAIKQAQLVRFELYNLAADEAEAADLAEKEPEKLRELTALLVDKYREVQAAGPVWEVKPDAPGKANAKKSREK
jgi:arylsulfatase A